MGEAADLSIVDLLAIMSWTVEGEHKYREKIIRNIAMSKMSVRSFIFMINPKWDSCYFYYTRDQKQNAKIRDFSLASRRHRNIV